MKALKAGLVRLSPSKQVERRDPCRRCWLAGTRWFEGAKYGGYAVIGDEGFFCKAAYEVP